jgi:glycerate kinase
LEAALSHFADCCAQHLGIDYRHHPGAGAAGGVGFAAHAFLRAHFHAGVALIADIAQLAHAVQGASLVFTGEGRLDAQTLHGKTPLGVARIAKQAGVPVLALVGALGEGYEALHAHGITAAFSLASGPLTPVQAYANAEKLLAEHARELTLLWLAAQKRIL